MDRPQQRQLTKAEIRADGIRYRQEISPSGKEKLDILIREQIINSSEFHRASVILLYAPVRGEIDLNPLVKVAWKQHKRVAYPVCNPEKKTMRFFYLEKGMELSPGAYGIPEPPLEAEPCHPDVKTLCLVPGVVFDRKGNRIGYGGGYYDKFLSGFPGVSMGVVYRKMVLEDLPAEHFDIPMMKLVTEQGIFRFKSGSEEMRLHRVIVKIPGDGSGTGKKNHLYAPLHFPPSLVLISFLFLLLSRLIETKLNSRGSAYLGVILLQMLIFLIPSVVYIRLLGENQPERLRFRKIRPEHIWCCICLFAVMLTGSLLLNIMTGGIAQLNGNFTLYNTFVARLGGNFWETLYVMLAYAVLPAFCEELMFRAVLCKEYEGAGADLAIFASAVSFAMLHFSFPLFPNYFFLGLLLAGSVYITGSSLTAMLLHMAYNLFCLFGQPYLSAFYLDTGSTEIFVFCLGFLFLLFGAFLAGEIKKIFRRYAENPPAEEIAPVGSLQSFSARLRVFLSPAVGGCVLFWLLMCILSAN